MSLKYDYFDGPAGLLQQADAAFAAGQAFVGSGASDIESLSLGDRNGSNLGAGSSNPGTYFDIDGYAAVYRVWISVAGEVAPASLGRTLVQVAILSGDSSAQAAVKIAAALSGLAQNDFTTTVIGNAIQSTVNNAKAVSPLTLGASGWGTASAAVVTAGVTPTGNYLQISMDLKTNAQAGFTIFTLNYAATGISSAILRGTNGNNAASNCPRHPAGACNCYGNNSYRVQTSGAPSSQYPQRQPNNLILKAYLAGITDALAQQNLYSYEVTPMLNVTDQVTTTVDLNFNFSAS